MPSVSVTTTQVSPDLDALPDLGESGQVLVIQNLGPDDLYVDFDEEVASDSGIKLASGVVWEMPGFIRSRLVYFVSSGTSDVRYTVVG